MTNENWMTGPSANPGFDSQGITVMTTNQHPTQERTSIMTNQHPIQPSIELLRKCTTQFINGNLSVPEIVKIAFSEGADAEPELPTDQELRDWHDECHALSLLAEATQWWALYLRHDDVAAIARAALAKWRKLAPLPTTKESLTDQTEALPND